MLSMVKKVLCQEELYDRELQVKEWNKSKNKNYYKVHMLNGGYKYVYMCEEMVKDFYGYSGYQLVTKS